MPYRRDKASTLGRTHHICPPSKSKFVRWTCPASCATDMMSASVNDNLGGMGEEIKPLGSVRSLDCSSLSLSLSLPLSPLPLFLSPLYVRICSNCFPLFLLVSPSLSHSLFLNSPLFLLPLSPFLSSSSLTHSSALLDEYQSPFIAGRTDRVAHTSGPRTFGVQL